MIDKRLYCETFSRLCASEDAKKEVFQKMNENKRKARLPKVLRAGAIAAAMVMALAATAGAVNLATGGGFFQSLRQVWSDGYETRYEGLDLDGNPIEMSVSQGSTVHTTEDGRLLLRAAGEEVDITDDLAEQGAYHFEKEMAHRTVSVDVTGTVEDWKLTETVTEADGTVYRSGFTSDEMPGELTVSVSGAVVTVGDAEDGAARESSVTVTQGEDGQMTLTDETGRILPYSGEALPSAEAETP